MHRKFELFEKWEDEQVKQLCFLSQILYVPHGRVIELDWSQAQYVYFVMRVSGDFFHWGSRSHTDEKLKSLKEKELGLFCHES